MTKSREDSINWKIEQASSKGEDITELKQDLIKLRVDEEKAKISLERTTDFLKFVEARLSKLQVTVNE